MNLHPFRAAHAGAAIFAVLMLVLPLMARAQAGAPSDIAVQGSWTRDVNASQWGETPQDVRALMVKLQAVTRPGGPDAFDVVWLRELLRRPAMYHLNDADQAWMRRTIAATEQAHLSHWQPAVTASPVPSPAAAAPAPIAPVAAAHPAVAAPVMPRATPSSVPSPGVASTPTDGLSAGWAMAIAALVVSLLLGLWINHSRQTNATPSV